MQIIPKYNSVYYMIEEEMKVGPKGQVVIPRVFRKALKIHPGSKVTFKLDGEKVVMEKDELDTANVFKRIAMKGSSMKRISPHLYEEELTDRVG
jgi:AbrB family looped-hinge helix DNA binding protein